MFGHSWLGLLVRLASELYIILMNKEYLERQVQYIKADGAMQLFHNSFWCYSFTLPKKSALSSCFAVGLQCTFSHSPLI